MFVVIFLLWADLPDSNPETQSSRDFSIVSAFVIISLNFCCSSWRKQSFQSKNIKNCRVKINIVVWRVSPDWLAPGWCRAPPSSGVTELCWFFWRSCFSLSVWLRTIWAENKNRKIQTERTHQSSGLLYFTAK